MVARGASRFLQAYPLSVAQQEIGITLNNLVAKEGQRQPTLTENIIEGNFDAAGRQIVEAAPMALLGVLGENTRKIKPEIIDAGLPETAAVIEESAILGIPAIQMRKSTERPQVYEFGSAVKFDPISNLSPIEVINKFSKIIPGSWKHTFGDGKASYRIVEDLMNRIKSQDFNGHSPKKYEPFSTLSFRE
jgi:hypothetical protein